MDFTREQILQELKDRGKTDLEIDSIRLDSDVKRLDKYLIENQGFSGSAEYEKVLQERRQKNAERAKLNADMMAQAVDDPSVMKSIDATGRGFNEAAARLLGAPVDIVSGGLGLVGLGSEEPALGSRALRRATQSAGFGYYAQTPERTIQPEDSIRGVGDMPYSTRPFAVAGEEIGYATGLYFPIAGFARGKQLMEIERLMKSANPINMYVGQAAKDPRLTAGLESGIAVLSGIGAGIAESVDPGDPTSRMTGSLLGGASPAILPLSAMGTAKLLNVISFGKTEGIINALSTRFMPGGDVNQVAKIFQSGVKNAGDDPKALADLVEKFLKQNPQYRRKDTKGAFSPGLATGDETLLAIERSLIDGDEKISKEAALQTKKSIEEMNRMFRAVSSINNPDPELLREIAKFRIEQLNLITSAHVQKQFNKIQALEAGLKSKIGGVSFQKGKAESAKDIKNILDATYKTLRDTEDNLWNGLDKNLQVLPASTEDALLKVASDESGLQGIQLPSVLRKLQEPKSAQERGGINSGQLLHARSEISKQIRNAMRGENPDRGLARRLHQIENGLLNDLNSIPALSVQLRVANQATINRYDFLKLEPVGQMFRRSGQGGLTAPDMVLDKLLMGRSQGAYNSFNDLIEAGAKANYSKDMVDPLAKFYFAMANDVVGQSGKVDLEKLGGFLTKHEDGLKRLGIFDVLKTSENQAHVVKKLKQAVENKYKNFKGKSMVSKVLGTTEVSDALASSLFQSSTRQNDLRRIYNLTQKKVKNVDNALAKEGVEHSIIEALLNKSVIKLENNDLIIGIDMLKLLSKKQGRTTLEQDLVSSRLLTKRQVDGIKKMANRASEFEKSLIRRGEGYLIPAVPPDSDMFTNILGRLGGAALLSLSPVAGNIGHGLIVAHIGSKVGQNFIDKMPNLSLRKIMSEAMHDPVLMKELLTKPTSILQKNRIVDKVGYMMMSKGLLSPDEAYEIENPEGTSRSLENAIVGLARQGKNANEIMTLFEEEARRETAEGEEGTTIGPYTLDYVQGILGMSDKDRAKIMENLERQKRVIQLKRSGPVQDDIF